jgi:hypothetical protein
MTLHRRVIRGLNHGETAKFRLTEGTSTARLDTLYRKVNAAGSVSGCSLEEAVMGLIARVLGVSVVTSALGVGLAVALTRPDRHSPDILAIFFLACVAGIIGAIAGAAREIVSAQRPKPPAWPDKE